MDQRITTFLYPWKLLEIAELDQVSKKNRIFSKSRVAFVAMKFVVNILVTALKTQILSVPMFLLLEGY